MIYEFAIAQSTESAETYYDTETLGISELQIEYALAGLDVTTFNINTQTAFTDDSALFSYDNLVRLRRYDEDITPRVYEYLFLGRVKNPQRVATGDAETYSIQIFGMWDWFEKTTMYQSWTEGTSAVVAKPRVILFSNSAGAHCSTGAQIAECVQCAIDGGCPVSIGAIDPGFTPPFDEQMNITVANAIQKALAYHPHASVWFDYSTRTPAFYCKTRTTLPEKSLSITGKEHNEIIPRNDLVPPAIAIAFEKDHVDGDATYRQTTVDFAPVISGETAAETNTRLHQVDVLWACYDLQGSSKQYLTQAVTVEPLPSDFTTAKDWWRAKCPEIADVADADLVLSNYARDGYNQATNELVEGAITKWMESLGVDSERENMTIEAKITYKDNSKVVSVEKKKLTVQLVTTDAETKTYKKLQRYDSGEEIPTGMASALWSEWQQVHYDGKVIIPEQEPSFDVKVGNCLNLTDGKTEWATMQALIKRVVVNIDEGSTVVEFGVPTWIDIDSRVAWYRACRGRRYAWSMNEKKGDAMPEDEGFKESQSIQDGAYRSAITRLCLFNPDATTKHEIDLDAQSFVFETSSDGNTVRIIAPRERVIAYDDNGEIKAKRAQVLCSEGYGDVINLGDSVEVEKSIVINASGKLQLVNDSGSPGNNYAYCTDSSGNKGWMNGIVILG